MSGACRTFLLNYGNIVEQNTLLLIKLYRSICIRFLCERLGLNVLSKLWTYIFVQNRSAHYCQCLYEIGFLLKYHIAMLGMISGLLYYTTAEGCVAFLCP